MSFVRNCGPHLKQTLKCGHCCNSSISQWYLLLYRFSMSTSCKFGGTHTSVSWSSAIKKTYLRHHSSSLNHLLRSWLQLRLILRPTLEKYEFYPLFPWNIEQKHPDGMEFNINLIICNIPITWVTFYNQAINPFPIFWALYLETSAFSSDPVILRFFHYRVTSDTFLRYRPE